MDSKILNIVQLFDAVVVSYDKNSAQLVAVYETSAMMLTVILA